MTRAATPRRVIRAQRRRDFHLARIERASGRERMNLARDYLSSAVRCADDDTAADEVCRAAVTELMSLAGFTELARLAFHRGRALGATPRWRRITRAVDSLRTGLRDMDEWQARQAMEAATGLMVAAAERLTGEVR